MQSILGNTRRTDITFRPDGRIDISSNVAKTLSLGKGDVLDVLDDGIELYLYVKFRAPTVGRHEATCFPTHEGSQHFRAWSKRLCRAVILANGAKTGKIGLAVGEAAQIGGIGTALPIIYKHILNAGQ